MKRSPSCHQQRNERGAVLVIALIMLLLTTLIVVSTFEMGTNNLVVVSNLESRQQTQKAAEATLEIAVHRIDQLIKSLGSEEFGVVGLYCAGRKLHRCIDLDGNGSDDIEVDFTTTAPQCTGTTAFKLNDVDKDQFLNYASCGDQQSQSGVVEGTGSTHHHPCSWANWNLVAHAVDLSTGSETRVRQGVRLLVDSNDIPTNCQ